MIEKREATKTMKKLLAMALIGMAVSPAMAVKFTDVIGDLNAPMNGYGNPNADLASLEITHDATSITFTFTTAGTAINSPDWIKLVMAIRGGNNPLNTAATTGWPRNFNITGGSDRWIGGWVDGAFGGFEARVFNGTDWGGSNPAGATWLGTPGMFSQTSGNTASYTVNLSTLNLAVGDSFYFDATTTGGYDTDGAWDPISTSTGQITAPDQNSETAGNCFYRIDAAPGTQTLSGTLVLNDVTAPFAVNRNMYWKVEEGTKLVSSGVIVVNSASTPFSIDVPSSSVGAARIVFDGSSFLKRNLAVTLTGANQAVGTATMQNGDVDNSGEVDAVDIDVVIANFGDVWPGGTGNPNSDVDASGEVDAVDIDVVIANFGGLDD